MDIKIDNEKIAFSMGIPFFKKEIPLKKITSLRKEKSSWVQGWGIKKIHKGWMWNISGFDIVRLELKDGKVFVFGTDKVDEILVFLQNFLKNKK